jgi:hypothetical protein
MAILALYATVSVMLIVAAAGAYVDRARERKERQQGIVRLDVSNVCYLNDYRSRQQKRLSEKK